MQICFLYKICQITTYHTHFYQPSQSYQLFKNSQVFLAHPVIMPVYWYFHCDFQQHNRFMLTAVIRWCIVFNRPIQWRSRKLLGRSEPPFRKGLCFTADVFIRQPYLRGPSADRHETLPHDRNLAQKKQKIPKTWGLSPKKYWGQKHAKFLSIFCNVRLWPRISPERLQISKS